MKRVDEEVMAFLPPQDKMNANSIIRRQSGCSSKKHIRVKGVAQPKKRVHIERARDWLCDHAPTYLKQKQGGKPRL